MYNFPMQKPGSFGVQRVYVKTGQIGGTNFLGGATPLTANTTTIFRLGGFAGRSVMPTRLGATTVTVPTDADGTLVAKLVRYRASDNTAVDLTNNLDLIALVTREESFATMLSSVADTPAGVLVAGDALEVHVVSDSAAIDIQPAGLVFTAEGLVLE
jgi:hypothetical protein